MTKINIIAITVHITSPKVIDHQIEDGPKNKGKINTKTIWNTRVLKREINADIVPLFNAVKKQELKIENPQTKKVNEYTFIAYVLNETNDSLLVKIKENGLAVKYENKNILHSWLK